jgi:hypothetical protein
MIHSRLFSPLLLLERLLLEMLEEMRSAYVKASKFFETEVSGIRGKTARKR